MPRILRIINRFNLGGPTYNVAYLTRYLSSRYETLLIGGMKDDTEDSSEHILNELGLKPIIIPEMKRDLNARNDIAAYRKIKQLIEYYKPDIVHTHASKAGTVGRLAAIRSNVPVIVHTFHGHVFHSYFSGYKTKIFQNIERGLAKRSTQIIAISEKQKSELTNEFNIVGPEKVSVIPLGFNLDRFRTQMAEKRRQFRTMYHVSDDELVISIVGRLVPIKNHDMFLYALKNLINNSNQKIRAFIVGDGESRPHIEHLASRLGFDFVTPENNGKTATVTFTSWIKKVDMVYAGSDIVALTSLNEGTPVSLIEAQASGKPVISTNVGGIENVVVEGVTGLLSKVNDVNDFSQKLCSLVANKEMRSFMSENGWKHVGEKFNYARLVNETEQLYDRLLQKQKKIPFIRSVHHR